MGHKIGSRLTKEQIAKAIADGDVGILERDADLSSALVVQISEVYKDSMIAIASHYKTNISALTRLALDAYLSNLPGWKALYELNVLESYQEKV